MRRHREPQSIILVGRALLGACFLYGLLLTIFSFAFAPSTRSDWKDINELAGKMIGGGIVISGLYLTWCTLRLNQEGQITDRFSKAVEQLGSAHAEVRLGGIYALQRIAHDSPRDHWTIMETLTAYVRHRSPRILRSQNAERKRVRPSSVMSGFNPELPVDIQAVLTVIGNRSLDSEPAEGPLINLWKSNLRGAMCNGFHLERANLIACDLDHASFGEAHLSHTLLMAASLVEATFGSGDLATVLFDGADLRNATFQELVIRDSTFFRSADLRGATFQTVVVEDGDFENANLVGTKFINCDLRGAKNLTPDQIFACLADPATLPRLPDYILAQAGSHHLHP